MPDPRVPAKLRQRVIERAYGCCEYCRSQSAYATQSFSVEHIFPRAKGGTTTLDNLAFACQGCNNHKYDKIEAPDSLSGQTVPLYHPRRDDWDEHFAWSDDFTLIVGITPTGRATIEALLLNREGVVNLRQLLYPIGKHPPPVSTER
jgi:5-methylcytosine-specific restriction endonuclease McrA